MPRPLSVSHTVTEAPGAHLLPSLQSTCLLLSSLHSFLLSLQDTQACAPRRDSADKRTREDHPPYPPAAWIRVKQNGEACLLAPRVCRRFQMQGQRRAPQAHPAGGPHPHLLSGRSSPATRALSSALARCLAKRGSGTLEAGRRREVRERRTCRCPPASLRMW